MLSEIRLKGRRLIIGSVPLFSLTLAVCIMLVFSLSLMPTVYKTALLPSVEKLSNGRYITLAVSAVLLVITAMSCAALKTGTDRYMLKKADGVYASAGDIFYYFRPWKFLSLMIFKIRMLCLRLAIYTLINIPSILCACLTVKLAHSGFSLAVTLVLGSGTLAFFLSGAYFYMRLTASLFLCEYYYIKGEYLNFRHLVASSQNTMKNKSGELVRLRLSFTGWFLTCFLIVTSGYVFSYYRQTLAAFANEAMKLQ